jgi:hypothetical protein
VSVGKVLLYLENIARLEVLACSVILAVPCIPDDVIGIFPPNWNNISL